MAQTQLKLSKREQLSRASSTVFIAAAVAAVVVMFSLMSGKFLWNKKSYNDRVITAKTKSRDAIETNVTNIDKLTQQFPSLESTPTTNATTILHALPPVYDYASLVTSLNSIAVTSGVKFNGSSGQDSSADALTSAPASTPIEIPITMQVTGSYVSIKNFMSNMEKSIRPIHVTNVTFSGNNESLDAQIQAVTYYQPARSLDVTKTEVR